MPNIPLRKLKEIRQGALEIAVRGISIDHPRLAPFAQYIIQNLEFTKIDNKINKEYGKKSDYDIAKEIAKGILDTNYMNSKAKKLLIQKGTANYTLTDKILHFPTFLKRKNIDNTIDQILSSSREIIYATKSSGQYDNMPSEPKEALEVLGQYDLKGTLRDIIHAHKPGKKDSLYQKAKEKKWMESEFKKVEAYANESRYAPAAIFFLFLTGFVLLGFSSANMTGFAVSGQPVSVNSTISAGFLCLLASLLISFLPRKKKQAENTGRLKKKRK